MQNEHQIPEPVKRDGKKTKAPPLKKIPRADGAILIGSARPLLKDPLEFFLDQYKKHGPVYEVRALNRRYVILAGVEATRFFRDNSDDLFDGRPIYSPYGKDIKSDHVLVGMEGKEHMKFRKAFQPVFSIKAMSHLYPQMAKTICKEMDRLPKKKAFSVVDEFSKMASLSCGEMITGCPFTGNMEKLSTFAKIFLGAGVGAFPGFMRAFPKYQRARKATMGFLNDTLEKASSQKEGFPHDRTIWKVLTEYRKSDGSPLTKQDKLASLHMPYSNSLVYVGSLAGFLLHFLIQSDDALSRCTEEAKQLFGREQPPELNEVLNAKWLNAALMETQRLQPISLSAPRFAAKDFSFMGFQIKKGDPMLIATAVAHYLPEYYPNPEVWNPSRFMPNEGAGKTDGQKYQVPPEAFVPFGFDKHACIASTLVRFMTITLVGQMIEKYEIRSLNKTGRLKLKIAPFPSPHPNWKIKITPKTA
jgi:cytochrome P450